jgi:hypothetical protein
MEKTLRLLGAWKEEFAEEEAEEVDEVDEDMTVDDDQDEDGR